jgi:hypothetical protein
MSKLHKPTLQALLNTKRGDVLVSIYMPTHSVPTPPNISEDRRRFKNLRNKVSEIISERPDIKLKQGQAIEKQLDALDEDLEFWENRTFGVAIFVNFTNLTTIDIPVDCDEYIAVDDQFHITPLIGLLDHMIDFAILVVSKKEPMLFFGDIYGLRSASVDLPTAQTGRKSVQERVETMHLPPKGKGRQEYYGTNFPLVTLDDVMHFYRTIDTVIQKNMPKDMPLVLAGTETDTCEFRSISSYPNILKGHIESANSATTPHHLAPFAWAFVQKATVQKDHQLQLERFERLSNGKDRASGELPAIQDAAEKGRVETLIIKLIRTTTDTIRDNLVSAPKIHFPPDEQMAVIEKVAMQTWCNNGAVTLIEDTETTPPNSALGAIFRY